MLITLRRDWLFWEPSIQPLLISRRRDWTVISYLHGVRGPEGSDRYAESMLGKEFGQLIIAVNRCYESKKLQQNVI